MKTTFKRDVQSVINLQKRIANQLVNSTPPGEDFVVGMAIVARAYNVSLEHAHRVADSLFRKNTFNRHKNRYFTSCVSGLYSAVCCAQGQNLYEVTTGREEIYFHSIAWRVAAKVPATLDIQAVECIKQMIRSGHSEGEFSFWTQSKEQRGQWKIAGLVK